MDESLRLFIAVELAPAVRDALRTARAALEKQGKLAVRWVDPDGAHLTLKFLGATPAGRRQAIVDVLTSAARAARPFTLQTAGLGLFPRPQAPRVVWLGVDGELAQLHALQYAVERLVAPLGYPTEARPFSPHLTLGRTQKDAARQELAAIGAAVGRAVPPPVAAWPVSQVVLMRSERLPASARYTVVSRIDLAAEN